MDDVVSPDRPPRPPRRLSRADRRAHLLEVALDVVREEGTDKLTLAHLAARAGVSKPVAYDHFGTRSGLLVELYRAIDGENFATIRERLAGEPAGAHETAHLLASSYAHCAASANGDWQAVGAALAGDADREVVLEEILQAYVDLFLSVLAPHAAIPREELRRRCVGLVGAAEAFASAITTDRCSEQEAATSLAALITGSLR